MKGVYFITTLLIGLSLACSLGGMLPSSEETATPSLLPPTQPVDAAPSPAAGGESPTMASYRIWVETNHSLDYPIHGCTVHSDILDSVVEEGGGVIPLGESYFYITWFPENWELITEKRLIVSLHGNGGCAEKNFNWWLKPAQEQGFAIAALQYAQQPGASNEPEDLDFMDAQEVYESIRTILDDLQMYAPLDETLIVYHGFSRGSALSFQMALMDRAPEGLGAFAAFISDSGGGFAETNGEIPGYIQNAPTDAYLGAHFWLYCGGKDHNGRTCQDMERMEKIIPTLGGVVDELYQFDPGGHGIFITAEKGNKSPPLQALFEYLQRLAARE